MLAEKPAPGSLSSFAKNQRPFNSPTPLCHSDPCSILPLPYFASKRHGSPACITTSNLAASGVRTGIAAVRRSSRRGAGMKHPSFVSIAAGARSTTPSRTMNPSGSEGIDTGRPGMYRGPTTVGKLHEYTPSRRCTSSIVAMRMRTVAPGSMLATDCVKMFGRSCSSKLATYPDSRAASYIMRAACRSFTSPSITISPDGPRTIIVMRSTAALFESGKV